MKDKTKMQQGSGIRGQGGEDDLGANSDIGMKLRAFYGSVQDESIPDKLLDLLEQLDRVEEQGKNNSRGD